MKNLFKDIVGQDRAKKAIEDWYLHEQQPLMLYGSSGYGKTTFAISLGATVIDATRIKSTNDLLKPIKQAEDGEILFIDEVHSLNQKIIESLYKIIDTGSFYDADLCMDLPLPACRFIFATNILDKLPEAFINRTKFVELQKYSDEELQEIVHRANPSLDKSALPSIIRASKGVPRTALSLAKSMKSAMQTEGITKIKEKEVNSLLDSRFAIDGNTGLNQKEYLIMCRVAERGNLSTSAIANILGVSVYDAKHLYIEPMRASNWLAVSKQGVTMGYRGHKYYRLFMRKEKDLC
jgi:Holliday junction resolvasome RuvABC ATP-dependent DNA helicase subunit